MTSPAQRRIGFLVCDGVQALDVVGPADAFGSDAFLSEMGTAAYEIVLVGLGGRGVTSSSGLHLRCDVLTSATRAPKLDTLIVPGGVGLRRPGVAERAAAWIGSRAPRIRRIASVCTGLYGLAPTGLLDGCRVTTHWSAVDDIARRYPKLILQPDALFLRSGKFYTSAGVTAGIDLALALVEEDHGPHMALAVAREMVVYVKRSGGQNQFSEPLRFQFESTDRFRDLAAWILTHLGDDLSLEALAARTYLSVRQFTRAFKSEFGTTPAAFVEEARLAEASRRLSASKRRVNVDAVARSVGYASADVFRRAFERRFGVAPAQWRRHFGAAE